MTSILLDAKDDYEFDILSECLPTVMEAIDRTIADGSATLVHCWAGINRSATLVIAYMVVTKETDLIDAFKSVVVVRRRGTQ